MSAHLYLAPAAGGKTAYLVEHACTLASDLAIAPRRIVSTQLPVRAWQRRLAEAQGYGITDDV